MVVLIECAFLSILEKTHGSKGAFSWYNMSVFDLCRSKRNLRFSCAAPAAHFYLGENLMDKNQPGSKVLCESLRIGTPIIDIPFLGLSNIWIKNTYQRGEVHLIQRIMLQALNETEVGQLSITGYDEDLSGVLAPFFTLASGEARRLNIISDRKQLGEQFLYFRRRIQDVQNLIQGRAESLIEFHELLRSRNENPVEGFELAVLVMNIGSLSDEYRSELARFLRVGPAFGLSFLILSPTEIESHGENGEKFVIDASILFSNINMLSVDQNSILTYKNTTTRISQFDSSKVVNSVEEYVRDYAASKLQSIDFFKIHDPEDTWKRSSIEGLSFCVGKFGLENLEITIGDEKNQRHNAVITGAVGTGKSNLISVIIHSLCMRYSPKELQLYLLDFKEGVSLKSYTNLDHEDYLPHAKAIGLESDISFGLSVLNTLFNIFHDRMVILKKYNVKSIRELRLAKPEISMPRIVVVIDEFQMMFDGNQDKAKQTAHLLEKSVRLYRAAGIHFILASQTLGGNQALDNIRNGLFNQIPIRIALKNSINESKMTLGGDNPHAAFLRPREAIVNVDYGEPSQNRKTVIAFADEMVLAAYRKKWWQMARAYATPPYVFELSKTIDFADTALTYKEKIQSSQEPNAMLGELISILHETVEIPLTREKGKNIAIFGLQDDKLRNAEGMIQGIMLSLALQFPRGNAEFILCDFDIKKNSGFAPIEKRYSAFFNLLDRIGYSVDIIQPNQFENRIKELVSAEEDEFETFFFALNMDKWDYEAPGLGKKSPLGEYLEKGPMSGRHFIGWWLKESTFGKQVTKNTNIDTIDTRVFLRIGVESVKQLSKRPLIQWTGESNRALICNSIEYEKEIVFIPYCSISDDGLKRIRAAFSE